jgi:hypothetical protein
MMKIRHGSWGNWRNVVDTYIDHGGRTWYKTVDPNVMRYEWVNGNKVELVKRGE